MFLSLLLDYGPSVEPVYDDRSTAIMVMIVIICVLFLLAIIFLYLWLENRHSKKDKGNNNDSKTIDEQLTESELQIISEYRKLDIKSKELVNNTIQTLISKSNKD